MAYGGLWFDPLRESLQAFADKANEKVNGVVKVKLHKGSATVIGRSSQNALYDKTLATYGVDSSFDQTSAEGFIELYGLQARIASAAAKRTKTPKA